jgi:hypothetical protein
MWAPGILAALAVLAGAAVMLLYSGLFVIGVPLFVIGVVLIGVLDFQRRRRHVGQVEGFRSEAKPDKVEFTEQDRRTLAQ